MPRKRLITFTQEIECQEDFTEQRLFFFRKEKKKSPKCFFMLTTCLWFFSPGGRRRRRRRRLLFAHWINTLEHVRVSIEEFIKITEDPTVLTSRLRVQNRAQPSCQPPGDVFFFTCFITVDQQSCFFLL